MDSSNLLWKPSKPVAIISSCGNECAPPVNYRRPESLANQFLRVILSSSVIYIQEPKMKKNLSVYVLHDVHNSTNLFKVLLWLLG